MRRCLAKVEHIRQGTREPGTIGALDEDIALHAHTELLNWCQQVRNSITEGCSDIFFTKPSECGYLRGIFNDGYDRDEVIQYIKCRFGITSIPGASKCMATYLVPAPANSPFQYAVDLDNEVTGLAYLASQCKEDIKTFYDTQGGVWCIKPEYMNVYTLHEFCDFIQAKPETGPDALEKFKTDVDPTSALANQEKFKEGIKRYSY